ncbi:helix-turn-helix transcriptional regulator [Companilactobacillus metriopterae]|uniref:helix-turn-helix transcriptional regulator n=1 Tax=Companilactobacillus metriopterae TaxID=1909267 RepID=UPI00100A9C1E|nr:helix-turn-helix transcriptional regulator [Companilactobacillus metriopterae]
MNKLKELREDQGWTQKDLANKINVSQKTVSAWELGTRTPAPKYMQQIEDILHVSKEDIFFTAFSYKM